MKIIFLNIWGGKIKNPLLDFFKKYSNSVDIFCLQEVFNGGKTARAIYKDDNMNIFREIGERLPTHKGYFAASEGNEEGLAIFVKKNITIEETGDVFVFRHKDAMKNGDGKTLGRNLQYISFVLDGKKYLVGNFHGLWNGINKLDSDNRLKQSQKIINFLDARNEDCKILGGDFNLLPETQSVKMLEVDLKNLIKEYNITSTRSSFYTKPEKFADYCFVPPTVDVKQFEVLKDEISDHLPLLVEI